MTPIHPALVASLVCLAASTAAAGELRVSFKNLSATEGDVRVAVFASQAAFDADQPSAGVFLPARPGGLEVVLRGLEPGTYAVSAFHDRNRNGELDRNLVGIPSEPFGFSNGARGRFGPPSFEAMSFRVGDSPAALELELQ